MWRRTEAFFDATSIVLPLEPVFLPTVAQVDNDVPESEDAIGLGSRGINDAMAGCI